MKIIETKLPGAFIIEANKFTDSRGSFARAWCEREFADAGLQPHFVQSNIVHNRFKGTLRGMHWQLDPHAETKLVRCTSGALYDVIIDLRPDSPTRGKWIGVELTAENLRSLYIPEGYAHGYQTLSDDTSIFYQVTAFYSPVDEQGLRWDDPAIGIDWPLEDRRIISEKDMNWPDCRPEAGRG
jgi:dTDP-4-dehydrorhamnose 3,5-epimerase